jgi:phosphoribosylaminoimidazolecarboxamide formyltransferase/IMP cyclohydrolase
MSVRAISATVPDQVEIRRALLSVSDKTGIVELAKALSARGVAILSTGGTAQTLREHGIAVTDVSQVTGFPEILDGRVKTLHPKIHGGLLAIRTDPGHRAAMEANGIAGIDLLVVNLYPFEQVATGDSDWSTTIENIDIGGPAMIRAAAKNHAHVAVATDPQDYSAILQALKANDGKLSLAMRKQLAAQAFARTAAYDAAVAGWIGMRIGLDSPRHFSLGGRLAQLLRYGENPHQHAALYVGGQQRPGAATAQQLQGKELSYNNLNDTDAAFEAACEFDPATSAAVAIIKHANPCGVAVAGTVAEAFDRALACDPVSAYGGIIASNRPIDEAAATAICELFAEVVIAPSVTAEASALFARKKNLRLLVTGATVDPALAGWTAKTIAGGLLVQSRDNGRIAAADLRVVTRRAPTSAEIGDLLFAFRVAKHVKSNAIVYARDGATVGIGAGQMSRVDSARIAALKAADAAKAAGRSEPPARGSVVASDAYFPFADGLDAAIAAGATAVIQPGGSMRDDEVIAAADKAALAMVFTGMRHFRH